MILEVSLAYFPSTRDISHGDTYVYQKNEKEIYRRFKSPRLAFFLNLNAPVNPSSAASRAEVGLSLPFRLIILPRAFAPVVGFASSKTERWMPLSFFGFGEEGMDRGEGPSGCSLCNCSKLPLEPTFVLGVA